MKICLNCKHSSGSPDFEKCYAEQNYSAPNPVNGSKKVRWIFCDTHRDTPFPFDVLMFTCGKRGRWFEPKKESNNGR